MFRRYELAASAIGGKSLDMIVVDCTSASTACVNHLKATGKGRANIMVLEQIVRRIRPVNMNGRASYPEGCPRLFDLIQMEDVQLKPAFYYVMRDCLVAENLDQADRVANFGHDRFKVITLRGEVVDISGEFILRLLGYIFLPLFEVLCNEILLSVCWFLFVTSL